MDTGIDRSRPWRCWLPCQACAWVVNATVCWRAPRGIGPRRVARIDLQEIGAEPRPGLVVQFTHPRCYDCQTLKNTADHHGVPLALVDVSEHPDLARKYGISLVPLAFKVDADWARPGARDGPLFRVKRPVYNLGNRFELAWNRWRRRPWTAELARPPERRARKDRLRAAILWRPGFDVRAPRRRGVASGAASSSAVGSAGSAAGATAGRKRRCRGRGPDLVRALEVAQLVRFRLASPMGSAAKPCYARTANQAATATPSATPTAMRMTLVLFRGLGVAARPCRYRQLGIHDPRETLSVAGGAAAGTQIPAGPRAA